MAHLSSSSILYPLIATLAVIFLFASHKFSTSTYCSATPTDGLIAFTSGGDGVYTSKPLNSDRSKSRQNLCRCRRRLRLTRYIPASRILTSQEHLLTSDAHVHLGRQRSLHDIVASLRCQRLQPYDVMMGTCFLTIETPHSLDSDSTWTLVSYVLSVKASVLTHLKGVGKVLCICDLSTLYHPHITTRAQISGIPQM